MKTYFDDVTIHIVKCLRKITHEIGRHSKHIHENYNITLPQMICLREIAKQGPISFSTLTKLIFLNNSTITGIVDRLENQGFVKRIRMSKDRRQIHLEATDLGKELLEKAPPPIDQHFIDNLKDLSAEELHRVIWSLEKIIKLFNTEEEFSSYFNEDAETKQTTSTG